MTLPLEISIEQMTGIALMPAPCEYPAPRRDAYIVCPECKREVMRCVGQPWECVEHGTVIPQRSAIKSDRAYVPDWSAA